MSPYRAGVAAVIFAAVVWGSTGTAAAMAPAVGPMAIAAAAMGIGGLLQAAVAIGGIRRARADLLRQWPVLVPGALAVAIYPLAFYGSMRLAGVTIGTVITIGAAPVVAALIEWLVDGARLTRRWIIGAGLGLFGVVLLSLSHHGEAGAQVALGVGLGLIGALTYALYSWAARRLMVGGVPSGAAMGATFGLGGLLLMPVLIATGAPFLDSWGNAAVGLYMAIVPMFLGYLAFGYGLARIPASLAVTITLIEPAVAAILAMIVLGERLGALGWTGAALVLACLLVVTLPARADRSISGA